MKACPKCKHKVREEAKFCTKCGYQFNTILVCSNCGKSIKSYHKFCQACGAPVQPIENCIAAKKEALDSDNAEKKQEGETESEQIIIVKSESNQGTAIQEEPAAPCEPASTQEEPAAPCEPASIQEEPTAPCETSAIQEEPSQLTSVHIAPQPTPEFEYIEEPYNMMDAMSENDKTKDTDQVNTRKPKTKLLAAILAFTVIAVVCIIIIPILREKEKNVKAYLYIQGNSFCYYDIDKQQSKVIDDEISLNYKQDSIMNMYGKAENYKLSHDGKKVIYSKQIDNQKNSTGLLYYYNAAKANSHPVLICSEVMRYTVNDKDDVITYLAVQGNTLYRSNMVKDDKEKIDDDVDDFIVSDDGKVVTYVKNANLYQQCAGKSPELIDSKIMNVSNNSKNSKTIYYTKDRILYRKTIGIDKTEIASDIFKVLQVYENGEMYYLKITADQKDKILSNKYVGKQEFILCYYDGKEETILSDKFNPESMVLHPEKPMIVYNENSDSEDGSYETFLGIQSDCTKINYHVCCSLPKLDPSGDTLYYFDDIEDRTDLNQSSSSSIDDGMHIYSYTNTYANLYEMKIIEGKVQQPELYEKDVDVESLIISPNHDVISMKNVDPHKFSGDLYINHTLADKNVVMMHQQFVGDKVIYLKDWDDRKNTKIMSYENENKFVISDDAIGYLLSPDNEIILAKEWNEESLSLYLYQDHKCSLIADNVTGVMEERNSRYVNLGESIYRNYYFSE